MKKGRVLFIREQGFVGSNLINYGLGVIATIASKQFEVKIIDNNSRYVIYSIKDILNTIDDFKPLAICFSIATINAYSSYQTIAAIKAKYPEMPIIAGGLHVSNVYKEVLEHKADYAVRGEADLIIIPLLESILTDRKCDIGGVSYYQNNKLVPGGICPLSCNLDNHSLVDYSLYDLSLFLREKVDRNILGEVLTQRGCPFNCTFCSDEFIRTKVRYRSVNNVIDELEYKNSRYGVDIITINDSDFTLSDERVISFCNEIIKRGLGDKFKFLIQSDTFKPFKKSTLKLMKSCGFNYISLGIERMDEASQKRINKKLKYDIIMQNLQNLKELDFVIQINYLIGFPFETIKLLQKENRAFKQLLDKYADTISASILMPMPGTVEYETVSQKDLRGWYLNPLLYQKYTPFYQTVKRLVFDPNIINIYSFDKKLIFEMLKTKEFFRKESIKKKGKLLYLAYIFILILANISEKVYYISPNLEHKIFGRFVKLLINYTNIMAEKWYRWTKKGQTKGQ